MSAKLPTPLKALDLAAQFSDAAVYPYVAAYVIHGTGPFVFGATQFQTMPDLYREFLKEAKRYQLPRNSFQAVFGQRSAVFAFPKKEAHTGFKRALFERNTSFDHQVVQVGNRSYEWHHAAGQYVAYLNRERQQAKIKGPAIHIRQVPTFGSTLVDYVFPDLQTMRQFCAQIESGAFEAREAALADTLFRSASERALKL